MGALICLRESGLVGMGAMFGGDVIQSRFFQIFARESYTAFNCTSSSESGLSEMLKHMLVEEGKRFGKMVCCTRFIDNNILFIVSNLLLFFKFCDSIYYREKKLKDLKMNQSISRIGAKP